MVGGDGVDDLVPERHRVDDPVGLRRRDEPAAALGSAQAERVAHDALGPAAGEHRELRGELALLARRRAARRPPSTRPRRSRARRRGRSAAAARAGCGRASNSRIGRRLTYCSNVRRIGMSRPQSDTWSGTPGRADRAEEDRLVRAQPVEAVRGHHRAGLEVALAAPVVVRPAEAEAVAGADRARARAGRRGRPRCRCRRRGSTAMSWMTSSMAAHPFASRPRAAAAPDRARP